MFWFKTSNDLIAVLSQIQSTNVRTILGLSIFADNFAASLPSPGKKMIRKCYAAKHAPPSSDQTHCWLVPVKDAFHSSGCLKNWKKKNGGEEKKNIEPTVDGRNPAPPGMYKTL